MKSTRRQATAKKFKESYSKRDGEAMCNILFEFLTPLGLREYQYWTGFIGRNPYKSVKALLVMDLEDGDTALDIFLTIMQVRVEELEFLTENLQKKYSNEELERAYNLAAATGCETFIPYLEPFQFATY